MSAMLLTTCCNIIDGLFAVDEAENTCTVAIVADYEFFTNVGNGQESTVRLTD